MKIIEPDCYIEYSNSVYVLHLLKNKKELKEDDTSTHVVGGYFMELDSSFKAIINWRKEKKYPFKCEYLKTESNFKKYRQFKKSFDKELTIIYNPIKQLQKELFVYEDKKCNFWKI